MVMSTQLPTAEQIMMAQMTRILVLDHQLIIRHANLAAQQLLAQSARKVIGSPFPTLVNYISLDFNVILSRLINDQVFTDNEVVMAINDTLHILTVSIQSLSDQTILLEFSPLDNQHRLDQSQIQQSQQQVATEMVRNLAHEIKNPLGGLRGAAQLLAKNLPDISLHEYTQVIIEQADRLTNLVDRLLGPQQRGKYVNQSIHQVVERVYRLLNLEKKDNVTIVRDYDPSLPEFSHDPDQIEQVLLNIGRNALQVLTQENAVLILRTRSALQVPLHGQCYRLAIRIDIEDNGPGVATSLQNTLFYPMVSGRATGSGLGLSIARRLIDQHRGKIAFTSWPGHTEFSVFLPIKK